MIPSQARILRAAQSLLAGGVVAYPTEAVWGLGCLPENRHAVQRVLELKNRPEHKGLILVSGDIQHFEFLLTHLDSEQRNRLMESWPGHHTWLVPHHGLVPAWICGQHSSVAIRVSAHPVIRALSNILGGALVSTSANPQGLTPARSAFRARFYFGDAVDYAPGQVGRSRKPSQIRDLLTGQIQRPA